MRVGRCLTWLWISDSLCGAEYLFEEPTECLKVLPEKLSNFLGNLQYCCLKHIFHYCHIMFTKISWIKERLIVQGNSVTELWWDSFENLCTSVLIRRESYRQYAEYKEDRGIWSLPLGITWIFWLLEFGPCLFPNLRPHWLFVLSLDCCYCLFDPFMSSSPACFCELDSHLSDLSLPSGSLAWPTLPALILLMPSSDAWFDSLVVTYHLSEPLWGTVTYKNIYSTTLSSLEITWKSKTELFTGFIS